MRLLLDTHVFLWFLSADSRLPEPLRIAIEQPENAVFLSVVSVWEAVIKNALGKLPLPEPAATYLPRQRDAHRIASLPIDEPSLVHLAELPPLHRDPFDRMLIAQAIQHRLTMASLDDAVRAYPVPLFPE
jgi:PIN domain nuclease of toxin-antitoxin system